jgi:hypothetical protein
MNDSADCLVGPSKLSGIYGSPFAQTEAEEVSRHAPRGSRTSWALNLVAWITSVVIAIIGCEKVEKTIEQSVGKAVQETVNPVRMQQSAEPLSHTHAALHAHALANQGSYPAAGSENPGTKESLSWRVQLLPYLGQQSLHSQIKQQGAWNSQANVALHSQMPSAYRSPHFQSADHKTVVLVPVSPPRQKGNTVFQPEKAGSLMEVIDGTSNVILVVEADAEAAVEWVRPADLSVEESQPKRGLGHLVPGGFSAVFVDGSVRFINSDIDDKILLGLFGRDDGIQVHRQLREHSRETSPRTVGAVSFR